MSTRFGLGACVALLAGGCGSQTATSHTSIPTAPSPSTPAASVSRSTFHVTGIVSDDDGNAVAGAKVTVQPFDQKIPSVSGVTDGSGLYSIDFDANKEGAPQVAYIRAQGADYDTSSYDVTPTGQNATQDIHLFRIERITAGESIALTVLPGDSMCGDDEQFVCRTVHIVAPAEGTMNIEAIPDVSALAAGLEVSGPLLPSYQCCFLIWSYHVKAGMEFVANVGMWGTSTAGRPFVLKTSLVGP